MRLFVLMVLAAAAMAPGCRSTGSATPDAWKPALDELLAGAEPSELRVSPDSTWVLAVLSESPTPSRPMPGLRLIVLERESGRVTVDETPGAGSAVWFDDDHIRFSPTPGMVREDGQVPSYLINAETGARSSVPSPP